MRIAIGQLCQETNTFNAMPTTGELFEQFGVVRGAELLERMAQTNELGGFIQGLKSWPERPEVAGLVRFAGFAGGRLSRATAQWVRRELLDGLKQAMPVDGVLLSLHGAMAAEGAPDMEGEVLQAVRQLVGPDVPVVATLDLHANVTLRMIESADALVIYHTYPHIDVFETGTRAAGVMRRILVDGARPVTAFVKIPVVVPAECASTEDPAAPSHRLRRQLQALEAEPGVLAAGLATVQPWLDVPELGGAVVVVTDDDPETARSAVARVATDFWQQRHDYLPELVPAAEAVRQAHETVTGEGGLVVLSDSADATTSGAAGDSTHVLRELLRYDWPKPALVTMTAPEVVEEARWQGVGTMMTTSLGGVRDRRFSAPITMTAEVAGLFDARFVMSGHLGRNLPIDMGPSAVLRQGNVHIVVTPHTGPHFAPQLFEAAGLDPFAASVVVAKSPLGFRAAYEAHARKVLLVQAPGCAPSDFWHYEYRNIPRPLWPWDALPSWTPAPMVRTPASVHPGNADAPGRLIAR
jgi:microcystin degradation protein MlrC